MPFDPSRQLNSLKQVLVQDKASIGFLLSAGCGVSIESGGAPLIPDIAGLTEAVLDELNKGESKESLEIVLKQFAEDKKNAPNVEDLLSHIRSLDQVAGLGEVRGLKGSDLVKLEDCICSTIATLVDQKLPNQDTPHHRLSRWTRSAPRSRPVELFTTNYDLLLEEALEDCAVPYFDGFIGARRAFFDIASIEQDNLPPRWARLWKLHGSINWELVDGQQVTRHNPSASTSKLLIHPSHLKYDQSRRMPYLAMMDRLRSFVARKQAFLVICGYSFGDEHINEAIMQGLRGNPNATAFALQFGALDDYGAGVEIAKGTANLSLLARDGAVLGTKRDAWTDVPKDSVDDTAGMPFIQWHETEANPDRKQASLALGDFRALGELFVEMMGDRALERQADE